MSTEIVILALAWLVALGVFIWFLWVLIPVLAGLAYVTTRPERIIRALEMAKVCQGETVFDLGAGDGRVLVIAAKLFEARAVGIEISPFQCLAAWWNARRNRVRDQVRIRWGSFYRADLAGADVVFAYMTSRQTERIRAVLERKLKPGVRVVAVSFEVSGWQPDEIDEENLLFLYRMPPTPGGLTTFLLKRAAARSSQK